MIVTQYFAEGGGRGWRGGLFYLIDIIVQLRVEILYRILHVLVNINFMNVNLPYVPMSGVGHHPGVFHVLHREQGRWGGGVGYSENFTCWVEAFRQQSDFTHSLEEGETQILTVF